MHKGGSYTNEKFRYTHGFGVVASPIDRVTEDGQPYFCIKDIPVVSTIGCDSDGNVYNINADTAAAYIAGNLNAKSLLLMTDISGILYDKDDPSTLIPVITLSDAERLVEEGVINGGMIPKVECCTNAIKWGVTKVFIIDGRVPHSILIETLTDEGIGTMFKRDV